MKLLFIICESGIDDRIMQGLSALGAPGYTRMTGAVGNGRHGVREGTPVWPGLNSVILSCVPGELVEKVQALIAQLNEERHGRLVARVFAVDASEVI
jgi:hypothetical protein